MQGRLDDLRAGLQRRLVHGLLRSRSRRASSPCRRPRCWRAAVVVDCSSCCSRECAVVEPVRCAPRRRARGGEACRAPRRAPVRSAVLSAATLLALRSAEIFRSVASRPRSRRRRSRSRRDVDRRPGRPARSRAVIDRGVAEYVSVARRLVRARGRRRAGEDVAAGVLRVGRRLDRLDELVDLGRDRVRAPPAPIVSFAPWTTRSRARWTTSPISPSAVSVASCHAVASSTFAGTAGSARGRRGSCSARLVPNGSSDGFVSSLPDESCCWVVESCAGDVLEVAEQRRGSSCPG